MRIAVFGASGRTGRLVARRARERGHDVTALVRSEPPARIDGASRTFVVDLTDRHRVSEAIAGSDAVVWAAGPIAGVTVSEISDALAVVVAAMDEAGVRRIVVTTNATVLTDREVTGEFANVAAEHRRNAATLRASDLDWTILAPPLLSDDPPTGEVDAVVDAKGPGRSLTRADLADALLDAVNRSDWIGHVVGVTNR
jgi:putative NADH-flavin reductase